MMLRLLIAALLLVPASVSAQDVTALDEQPPLDVQEEVTPDPVVVQDEIMSAPADAVIPDEAEVAGAIESVKERSNMSLMEAYPQMSSIFFSRWEHDLLIEARKGLNVRPPEVPIEDLSSPAAIQAGDIGTRELSLGGIVFNKPNSWTIWLNGMRVTPNGLPEQVMDIKVFKDYIEIEWLDTGTNQIYPIRLRTHQRFNLDTRIFLPG